MFAFLLAQYPDIVCGNGDKEQIYFFGKKADSYEKYSKLFPAYLFRMKPDATGRMFMLKKEGVTISVCEDYLFFLAVNRDTGQKSMHYMRKDANASEPVPVI